MKSVELRGGLRLGMSLEEAKRRVPGHDLVSYPEGQQLIRLQPTSEDSIFGGIYQLHMYFVHNRAYQISIAYYRDATSWETFDDFASHIASQFGLPNQWIKTPGYDWKTQEPPLQDFG